MSKKRFGAGAVLAAVLLAGCAAAGEFVVDNGSFGLNSSIRMIRNSAAAFCGRAGSGVCIRPEAAKVSS